MTYHYFSENEFRRATPACSLSQMDSDFMHRLEYARSLAGVPFIINSAYRSPEYEVSKGRTGTSSHCRGIAVDIRCDSSSKRLIIVQNLLRAGFRRIGIASTFIHVDSDSSKATGIGIWLY